MKKSVIAMLVLTASLSLTEAWADESADEAWIQGGGSAKTAPMTQEMWFYTEAWRRHDHTQLAVRR